ncbi:MAG: hypothetical protein GY832_46455 [Chloroflexi bacterium]|nr:hypothetical protein [Chloroflexota bacterium]
MLTLSTPAAWEPFWSGTGVEVANGATNGASGANTTWTTPSSVTQSRTPKDVMTGQDRTGSGERTHSGENGDRTGKSTAKNAAAPNKQATCKRIHDGK